jgi:hypothetical protein
MVFLQAIGLFASRKASSTESDRALRASKQVYSLSLSKVRVMGLKG